MAILKSIFGWIGRQGVLLVLIMAALAFYQFAWPQLSSGKTTAAMQGEWLSLAEVREDIERTVRGRTEAFDAERAKLAKLSGNELKAALDDRQARLQLVQRELGRPPGFLSGLRPSAVVRRNRLKIEEQAILAELTVLELAVDRERRLAAINEIRVPKLAFIAKLKRHCEGAKKAVDQFNDRSFPEKYARNRVYGEARRLSEQATASCSTYRSARQRREEGIGRAKRAISDFHESQQAAQQRVDDARDALNGFRPELAKRTLKDLLVRALVVLAGIIALPFIIRLLFFFVLAPLAERRAAIRIVVLGDETAPIAPTGPSRVSIPVTLGAGEEVLVRQDYLQTTSLAGRHETQWLLDWRHPLSSFASGMTFLTRVRGDGETTTVSAVRDPFAELTEIRLPAGAACVLHPRALVAIVQPQEQSMRITSHWRLLSLNAWLTLQLRYLVFHGPGRLIVMGGRGIRVERAEQGRVFGQDQLVGFSSDLSYSVARTETFWPYFLGREQLFKDKVRAGSGILIIEEAPLSARKSDSARRGLEGMFDAALKAFGI